MLPATRTTHAGRQRVADEEVRMKTRCCRDNGGTDDDEVLEPHDVQTDHPLPRSPHPSIPQTWRSLPLPFLPRSEQFHAGEHVQLARLLVGALAVARAAAAAARVRLLPLARLPLLADEGAGDGRCPGHADVE